MSDLKPQKLLPARQRPSQERRRTVSVVLLSGVLLAFYVVLVSAWGRHWLNAVR